MAELTYLQAISDGLRTEMRRDKRVFLIGEDVGVYGGAFKVSAGFQEEFGPWRVIDAPLAETAIVGGCTGAAIMGLRPVAEMQFIDFISCAWDHLVTIAAKQRWRAGTPVPMVVRLPSGGGFSGGPFHSQNPESSFAHIPGLKCVCPATPEDAKGLLISAIEDPNPVLYFEHKHLYRRIKGEVPEERYTTPLGKARIHREGTDVSVITWGAMVYTADDAAQQLDSDGVSVEVVDLRTVMPWDKAAVLESVRKTSKVLVLHEDTRSGGFGGEIAATIGEEAFEDLDAPVEAARRARLARPVLARAREGVHPSGRRRRRRPARARGVLGRSRMATETAVDVVMPQMGVSVSEGTVTRWLKQEGEQVEADEPLLEISTDKVDTEVPSPASGTLTQILVQEGETVDVGTKLGQLGGSGAAEAPAAPAAEPQAPAPAAEAAPEPEAPAPAAPEPAASEPAAPAPAAPAPAATGNGKAFVSPVVARIAGEHGIDPSSVPGTGSGGRVTKTDILAFVESGGTQQQPQEAAAPAQSEAPAPQAAPPAAAPAAPAKPAAPAPGPDGRDAPRRDARADHGNAAWNRRAHGAARSTRRPTSRARSRSTSRASSPSATSSRRSTRPPTASTRPTSRSSRRLRSRRCATTPM